MRTAGGETEPGSEGAAPGRPLAERVRAVRSREGRLPPERRLAAELGVKRHQLRKALAELRAAGEIAAPARRVPPPQHRPGEDLAALSNPLEVIELRLILEPSFARLASLRASAVEIARILEAATTPAGADGGAVDLAFHFAVAAAARNNLGNAFYAMLRRVGTDARNRVAGVLPSSSCPTRLARRDAEHRRVAEAIAARDPDAAEAAMRAHLLAVQARIMERSSPGRVAAA